MSLPPLYILDNYWSCVANGGKFCLFNGYISSTDPNNAIWGQIQLNSSNPGLFDRSLLHRGKCVPREYSGDLKYQKQYEAAYLYKELKHLNLTARVEHLTCIETPTLATFDYVPLMALALYYVFFITVSVFDKWIVKQKSRDALIWNFSIFHNWNKASVANDGDHQKLKCIQGLRFILMAGNLVLHTLISYLCSYLDDPILFEKKMGGVFHTMVFILTSHIVQPFFLISSWLCTTQIYNVYEANGKFTFRDVIATIVNRYFRLSPLVAIISIFMSTNWMRWLISSPHAYYLLEVFQVACQNNILPTLFFVNNYFNARETCNLVTWYLSADFQYYVLVSITMYLILKYKCSVTKVITIGFLASWIIYGSIIYANNLDMVYKASVRTAEPSYSLDSVAFKLSYSGTHSSLTTPILGMMFGFIYVKNRQRTALHLNKTLLALWYILFYGILSLALYLSLRDFHPVITALLGPLLKPLFAFSFGVGILGMSHGLGGVTKSVLESKFAVTMGRFCFGTYITHVAFCFTRGIKSYELYPASYLEIDYIVDLTLSFMTGTFISLSIEQPASVLQKMILPQVMKKPKLGQE